MKTVKCEKCHLTYDKKKKTCPYCGKKTPKSIMWVFITIMILFVAFGTVICILNAVGLSYKVVNVEHKKALGISAIQCDIEITNKTGMDQKIDFEVSTYIDDYKAESFSFFSEDSNLRVENLKSGKKIIKTLYLETDRTDWKTIELYYRENRFEEYKLLCKINREDLLEKNEMEE